MNFNLRDVKNNGAVGLALSSAFLPSANAFTAPLFPKLNKIASINLNSDAAKPDYSNLPYQKRVTELAEAWRAKYHLPGVWCAFIKDGKVVACVAIGYKNIETKTPASLEDHLNIGSVSKVITGSLLAFFVADGTIKYETTVADVFPNFAKKYSESPLLKATVRQLMTHVAGIPKSYTPLTSKTTRIEVLVSLLQRNDLKSPGLEYQYSYGCVIVTAMIEELNKTSYDSWLKGKLGKRLGLESAHQLDVDPDDVSPHNILESGTCRLEKRIPIVDKALFPAGQCSVTLPDLCRFCQITMNNGEKLPSSIYDEMIHLAGWEPPLNIDTPSGWTGDPEQFLTHNGSQHGYGYTEVYVSPRLKRALIFYTNCNGVTGSQEFAKLVMSKGLSQDLNDLRWSK